MSAPWINELFIDILFFEQSVRGYGFFNDNDIDLLWTID